MSGKLFHITTFGCQMNVYDSEKLSERLRRKGWKPAADREEADFVFFNTCSIREKAARRVIGGLQRLKPLKAKNPQMVLGVGGCVAEQEGRNLLAEIPWLNLVAGPGRLDEVADLLDGLTADMPPAVLAGRPETTEQSGLTPDVPAADAPDHDETPAPLSAFLTIMQGCDNYCAYCVVPYLRGRETSRPSEEILREARDLVRRGAAEIVLLGQNVNSSGRPGRRGGQDFVALLKDVAAIEGLKRLRFTTSHPKDFSPELVELFGQLPPLCEHVHLPLQAGADAVLKAMGRRYDRARYLDLVARLRAACPEVALSTDLIVGFPGETEENFQETLTALEIVRFDSIYSFKYDDRPQTKASTLPDKVPEEEKARRLALVQELQKNLTLAKHRTLIGRTVEVLAERPARRPGQLAGRTRDNKIVNFEAPSELVGRLVRTTVVEAWPVSLIGRLAEEERPERLERTARAAQAPARLP
ncbi:MAG: tRNA (N6-isopentenyl adenosine(37)-C2)-methylthiotransferase MiaB [Deltaproteobacteria bacterium]|jgi:tRNA-2-methylthio-N6-dimethylallyladenosine synthase|nr:tRNA (N6-isopentenyl adenosine(37)-C2)-methylthiotransferase MiaB [Deltaproteobacteria bacterium]